LVATVICDHRLVSAGFLAVVAFLALIIIGLAAVRTVPPQQTYVVELLGRYRRTLEPGVHLLVPFTESVRAKVDMREQVATFPPQPAITSDNLVACIDTVLYYRVVDPVRATYEIANSVQAMEMLTITTLRDLTSSMDLERARASRDEINLRLTDVLDKNTGAWGIKVIRAEIKAIEIGSRLGCP
jgi:regulator of protease activity HflC (stomatin/prohibitin superfamily)